MSIEQWAVLALVVFLPLLEGVARLQRTRASSGGPSDRVAQAPKAQRGLPPPLPQPASQSTMSLSGLPASNASTTKRSGPFEAHTRTQKPAARDAAVQWLRPVRNLRRAIVVATILGPPTQ